MTPEQLRELDAFCRNLIGEKHSMHRPTVDYGPALAVLEKCVEAWGPVGVLGRAGDFEAYDIQTGKGVHAETLPLAVCVLAKALFNK